MCSDLKRAHETAEIICAPLGLVPEPTAALRECSLGVFEGMHKDEIHGPKFSSIFARLSGLSHDARLDASYFVGVINAVKGI